MPAKPLSVIVVDDELAMRRALSASLTASGYLVEQAQDGEEALRMIRQQAYDLVLLDINMPGPCGIKVCGRIRPLIPNAGIIMITVFDALEEKVKALDAGADDYITKPFLLRELLARLRAVARRARLEQSPEETIRAGSLELDAGRRSLRKDGREIHLSPIGFDLLAYFMQHLEVPLDHSRLLKAVWGPDYGSELEYLRSYVRYLRKKIESDPANPEYLLTEPWIWYRFRVPRSTTETRCATPEPQPEPSL
jgi:two-component system KDP operon response regulator KdpE